MILKDEERTRVECWTRVMGYHRPVSAFNRGKKQEHRDRMKFQEVLCDAKHNDIYPEMIEPVAPPTCKAAINYISL